MHAPDFYPNNPHAGFCGGSGHQLGGLSTRRDWVTSPLLYEIFTEKLITLDLTGKLNESIFEAFMEEATPNIPARSLNA